MKCTIWAVALAAVSAVLLLCYSATLQAQVIRAAVSGTVTDASGAVIPGAQVTAADVNTGIQTKAITNDAGLYNIRFLQIGRYRLTVAAQGFTARVFGPFTLEAN